MEIISATALISINETFYIQLISFLVFLFILNRVMIQPLLGTMHQRKTYLEAVSTDIDQAQSELTHLHEDIDHQRTAVLKEANAVIYRLEEEAEHNAAEVLKSAQQQISQLRHETEARVKAELKQARSQLSGEVDALTTLIMEKVLHRRLS